MCRFCFYTDKLDAMIAPALKTLLSHVHFRKRAIVEEQRAQKCDRLSGGRQIAFMICEHCRATGAYEAVQGLSDLFKKNAYRMKMFRISGNGLGGTEQVKIARFCSASDCIGSV